MDQLRNPLPYSTDEDVRIKLRRIFDGAKAYRNDPYASKRFIYERFKQQIIDLNPSGEEYSKAIWKMSRINKMRR